MNRSPVGSSFDDFIDEIWREAREDGPEAVAETAFAEQRARFAAQMLAFRVACGISQVELARVKGLLGVPAEGGWELACCVALGYPTGR
jgi:hypothetical protein